MRFEEIKNPFLVSKFNLNEITCWNEIDFYKRTFIISNNPNITLLRYPGFCFKTIADSEIYFDFYSKIYNMFTPPRGNLSSDVVFMGIKPGSYQLKKMDDKGFVSECSWLLGPSSKRLNVALYQLNIYPYFTNVFHAHEQNGKIKPILDELKVLFSIHKRLKIFFMGNYKEFDKIISYLSRYEFDFEYHKIWHPAYILRNGDKNFNEWVNKIKSCL